VPHGRKPTRAEKEIIASKHLIVANWLVLKHLQDKMHIMHRHTGIRKILNLKKER
jgi:hypothetical protein